MYAVGKKGWNSIENCFRKFRKKYTDGGMCLNIVSIVYFTLYFSIKYITQIALDKNSSLAKSWSKLNTKRKLDLVDPLPNGLAMASMMLLPRDLNTSFRKTHQIKIILHRIISVVWLTNFLSEIRNLINPRWWVEQQLLSVKRYQNSLQRSDTLMIAHLPITGGWRELVLSEWLSFIRRNSSVSTRQN